MSKPERPNFLFLFGDEQVYDSLGCAGNGLIETPHLDALAGDGLRFDAAYSNAPVCTPYRAALFSGRYGSQTNTLGNSAPLPTDQPCLADTLEDGGYHTSYVGKWHLGATGQIPVAPQLRGGFRDFLGYQCYNDFLHNVAFYDADASERRFSKHRTEATADLAIERLQGLATGDDPFALFVSWQNPHYPLEPTAGWAARYANTEIPLRPNQDASLDPFTPTYSPRSPAPYSRDPNNQRYGEDMQRYLRLYYAMVSLLDEQVGRVLAWLRILGLDDNTIVVFTSDHGECQGSHSATIGDKQRMLNKGIWWEESARVPQLMRLPGQPGGTGGRAIAAPVGNVDFYPTFCDYAGISVPAHCEGHSLRPLIEDPGHDHGPVFCEMKPWSCVRLGDWKLVYDRASGQHSHLYDLAHDPYELNNRLDDPSCTTKPQQLGQLLATWETRVRG